MLFKFRMLKFYSRKVESGMWNEVRLAGGVLREYREYSLSSFLFLASPFPSKARPFPLTRLPVAFPVAFPSYPVPPKTEASRACES